MLEQVALKENDWKQLVTKMMAGSEDEKKLNDFEYILQKKRIKIKCIHIYIHMDIGKS